MYQLWSRQESNLHLMFRKHPFPPRPITKVVKFTELQHTSATHFGIFHYPNFSKSNPVVTIDNLFVFTILEPLGNTYSFTYVFLCFSDLKNPFSV